MQKITAGPRKNLIVDVKLMIVLYSYMNGDYSSHSMELNCKKRYPTDNFPISNVAKVKQDMLFRGYLVIGGSSEPVKLLQY